MSRKIGYTKRRKNKVSRRRNTNLRKFGYTKRRKNKISRRRNSKIKNKVSKRTNRTRNNKKKSKRMRGGSAKIGDTVILKSGVKAVVNNVVTDTRDDTKIMYDVSWNPNHAPEATYTSFVYASNVQRIIPR